MYSRRTIKLLQVMINVGYKLKIFPFKLTINKEGIPKLQRETNKIQHILWKMSIVYYVSVQELYLALGLWYDLTHTVQIQKRAQFYIVAPPFLIGVSILSLTLLFWEKMILLFNTLALFGYKLHKYHGTTTKRKDGLELPLRMFVMAMFVVALLSPMITFRWIIKKVHVWSILSSFDMPVILFVCSGVPLIALADYIVVLFLVGLAMIYVTMSNASLNMMTYSEEKPLTSKGKRELIAIYRAHQIYNNLANEEFRGINMLGLSTGALAMIALSFALIGFYHILPLQVIGATFSTLIVTFLVNYFACSYAAILNNASLAIPTSFLHDDLAMKKIHRKCFKACKPLHIGIGDVTRIEKLTFPVFMHEVVVANVVDLLMM